MNKNKIERVGQFLILPLAITQGKKLDFLEEARLSQAKKITLIALSSLVALFSFFTSVFLGSKILSSTSEAPSPTSPPVAEVFNPSSLRIKVPKSFVPSPEEETSIPASTLCMLYGYGPRHTFKTSLTYQDYFSIRMVANSLELASRPTPTDSEDVIKCKKQISHVFNAIVELKIESAASVSKLGYQLDALKIHLGDRNAELLSPIETICRSLRI